MDRCSILNKDATQESFDEIRSLARNSNHFRRSHICDIIAHKQSGATPLGRGSVNARCYIGKECAIGVAISGNHTWYQTCTNTGEVYSNRSYNNTPTHLAICVLIPLITRGTVGRSSVNQPASGLLPDKSFWCRCTYIGISSTTIQPHIIANVVSSELSDYIQWMTEGDKNLNLIFIRILYKLCIVLSVLQARGESKHAMYLMS